MSKPVLYMLNPWYDAPGQGPFYCPDCGIVEGFFILKTPESGLKNEISGNSWYGENP